MLSYPQKVLKEKIAELESEPFESSSREHEKESMIEDCNEAIQDLHLTWALRMRMGNLDVIE